MTSGLLEPNNMDIVGEENDRKSSILLPVTVISAILMVVGVVGNVTVVVVMATRMSKKAINCFVLALAATDLISCIVCVPMDIVELQYPYLFTFTPLCKLLRFSRSLTTITSGFLLIAIATERYRLICKFQKARHFSGKQALITCAVVFVLALIVALPSCILFGQKTVSLSGDFKGTECSISDSFQQTVYPIVYYSVLILLFFGTFITLCVLYAFVGFKIWKGRKLRVRRFSDVRSYSFSTLPRDKINNNADVVNEILEISEFGESLKRGISFFGQKRKKEYSRRRTTFIMVVMTSVFLIGCLPYIIISICRFVIDDIDLHISDAAEVFFHFSLKSFMFSAAINPYIYGFCNERFKKELFNLPLINRIKCEPDRIDTSDTSQSPQYSTVNNEEVGK